MSTAFDSGHIPEITIRHRLRIAREEAGYEQGQLAELIGVGRNTVSNAESGKTKPRKVMVNAWAMATGVPVKWLETGEAPTGTGPDGGECPQSVSIRRPADYKADVLAFPARQRGRESDYAGREVAA